MLTALAAAAAARWERALATVCMKDFNILIATLLLVVRGALAVVADESLAAPPPRGSIAAVQVAMAYERFTGR